MIKSKDEEIDKLTKVKSELKNYEKGLEAQMIKTKESNLLSS